MAGGPVYPHSTYPAGSSGLGWTNFYAGGGGNLSPHEEGMFLAASLSSNTTFELRFTVPSPLPSGSLKLLLRFLANATSGLVLLQIEDTNVTPPGVSPSAASLTTEAPWSAVNVSGVTSGTTNTTVTTSTAHGLAVNDVVKIASVGGATQANGTFTVTSVGSSTTFNITTTSTSSYTSGGTVTQQIGVGWLTGNTDEYLQLIVPLTPTPSALDEIVMALTGLTSGWTLASNVCIIASLIWQ